jgi:carbon storage regulator CsrA
MLVVARRVQESLIIPSIQAAIHVVAVRSNAVRLGVEAPSEVTVLRGELYERLGRPETPPAASVPPEAAARHEHLLRNHLNNVSLALGMLRRQLGASLTVGVRTLLDRAAEECQILGQHLQALCATEVQAGTPAVAPASLLGAGI